MQTDRPVEASTAVPFGDIALLCAAQDRRFSRARFRTAGAGALWDGLPQESKDGNRPGRAWSDADAVESVDTAVVPLSLVPTSAETTEAQGDPADRLAVVRPMPLAGEGERLLVKVEGHRLSVRRALTALGWAPGTRLRIVQEAAACWSLSPVEVGATRRDLVAEVVDDRGRLAFSEEAGRALRLPSWGQALVVISGERLLLAPVAALVAA